MISFSNINKQYGKQLLFVDASFQLNPGEKVGLVGPNGSGKTTLFRMVVGEETPDEGAVSVPKKLTIGYGSSSAALTDFFTSSGPLAILSIISDKCRRRHAWEISTEAGLCESIPETAGSRASGK